jgi:hypothetical protein
MQRDYLYTDCYEKAKGVQGIRRYYCYEEHFIFSATRAQLPDKLHHARASRAPMPALQLKLTACIPHVILLMSLRS